MMSANAYKYRCHKLIDEVFGVGREGRARAYGWMKKKYGREIHFRETDDINELRRIHDELLLKSLKAASQLYGTE